MPTYRIRPFHLLSVLVLVLGACSIDLDGGDPIGGEPCPESEFTCITVTVPLDHTAPDSEETIDITFAVLPATGEREGALVVVVGGPGASGVYESDLYLPSYPEEITESYDLVFFDQRGVELYDETGCPRADEALNERWEALRGQPDAYWEGLIELTESYVAECTAEIGDTEMLAYLGTTQAVHDLEAFRERMGYERLILQGESYGTSFAQAYAATYPQRVERMVLDGPLDPSRDGLQTKLDQIEALDATLARVFEYCDRERPCKNDMTMPTAEAYRTLIDRLDAEPAVVSFPVEPDTYEDFTLTAEDVGYLAYNSSYLDGDRMLFLRALAAAVARDDLRPMVRLFALGNMAGLSATVNTTVTCLDQPISGAEPTAEIAAMTAARDGVAPEHRWFYEPTLTCAFWPHVDHGDDIADPYLLGDIPTLMIASDTDPATPYSHAVALIAGLGNGHLLTVRGGYHIMFGRGYPCIDDAVVAFLLEGTPPETDTCFVEVTAPYLPLIPEQPKALERSELLLAIDNELFYLPELAYWDGITKEVLACDHGGGVTFTGTPEVTKFALDGCALTQDLVVDGTGSWNFAKGSSRLEVTLGGCEYRYTQVWETGAETMEEECS